MKRIVLIHHFAAVIACLVFSLVGTGCMAIKGNQLADLGRLPSYQGKQLSSVEIDVDCTVNGQPVTMNPEQNLEKHNDLIRCAVEESGIFARIIATNTMDALSANYLLKYNVDNYGNRGLAMVSGFITGFSLFIIPGGAVDHWQINAILQDRKGVVLSDKRYEDKMTCVMWLPLLPACFFEKCRPMPVYDAILLNMYRHSMKDITSVLDSASETTSLSMSTQKND